jgi:phenylacetate-CoA ligase
MVDASYVPFGLEPIEKASRDEIAALQLDRLKWSLHHAYFLFLGLRDIFYGGGVHR